MTCNDRVSGFQAFKWPVLGWVRDCLWTCKPCRPDSVRDN